ncbi:hypothetical protein V5N11_027565 [Cardamine amara subsp. amara]|uniref:C2H2-type domain-containing protein n=1 Tax=Cardamine amara subsp. amara TaxID=228776 RepID=A0ABD0ZVL9_CARAN
MGGLNSRYPSRIILLCFFISSQFWGLSVPSSILQQNLEGFKDPGDERVSIPREDNFHEIHCSRERSRAAWQIIDEYLMPFVEKEKYQLPSNCRVHRDNDIYREQEEHKVQSDINEWSCGFCKKSFYEEKFLDKHFDSRHYNLLNASHGRCLADLCGALHCDLVVDTARLKSKCNPAAAARNRHLCESFANSCFPVDKGPSANRLHDFFLRQFCDGHTCSGGSRPLSIKPKSSSMWYIIISIVTLILLLLNYTFIYLYRRGLKSGSQELKRIRHNGLKKKPS